MFMKCQAGLQKSIKLGRSKNDVPHFLLHLTHVGELPAYKPDLEFDVINDQGEIAAGLYFQRGEFFEYCSSSTVCVILKSLAIRVIEEL